MNAEMNASRNGSQIIVSALEAAGVEVAFGYPGGQVIPLYDAIYDAKFKHILTRHEQGAAHAADGYARATGRVGVLFATSGPGATNIVTGLATANMDSVPLLAITGQVPTTSIGNDTFQEADIYGISIPITKYNYLVKEAAKLPQVMAEAFYLAGSGRPGPVLVDVPKDVQVARLVPPEAEPVRIPGYNPAPSVQPEQVEALLEALKHSKRPVAFLGGGAAASGAEAELFRFLTESDIPSVSTITPCPWACRACTGPNTPTWPFLSPISFSAWGRVSTTAWPATSAASRPMPRWCMWISTRPRSASASIPTFRCWAT